MDTHNTRKQRNLTLNTMLGERLRVLRRTAGLGQRDISEHMGFGRSLVSKIEHGQRALDAVEIYDYAAALHVSPERLITELAHVIVAYDSSPGKSTVK